MKKELTVTGTLKSERLRQVIKEGFKEYDGDIKEEAIELIIELETNYGNALAELASTRNSYVELGKENTEITEFLEKDDSSNVIDFGTGKLYYHIEAGSVIVLNELMQALKDAAMVVPLHRLVNSIKKRLD